MVEFCGTLIMIGLSFCFPRMASNGFNKIECAFGRLARKKTAAVVLVGTAAFFGRLAILPICPIPLPFVTDDFSFLLAADTFAHGRLANPTPAMWIHFETIHLTLSPSYVSMYFPGQGLILAASQVLFGRPWFGLLIVSALMCAAICWMLQAWLPPSWALLGGVISVVHLGLFSYWINTYHAAGGICALGGALILGALPRLMKTAQFRYGLLLGIGIALLLLTRPYEGMLLCLPVLVVLGRWALVGKNRPTGMVLLRRAALPLAVVVAAGSWLAYYDYRAFGKPTTLPYTVDRSEYAMAPYYVWQSQRPEPAYRHAAMRAFYHAGELEFYRKIHNVKGFVPQTLLKFAWTLNFYTGFALLPPLFFFPRLLKDRRMRLLVICAVVMMAGMLIQIFLLAHYVAAYTAMFYAFGLQGLRHMRQWRPEGRQVGLTMARLSITLCLMLAGLRLIAGPLHLMPAQWPTTNWNFIWFGPGPNGWKRSKIEAELKHLPGKQLVLVRYSANHNYNDEWVYNAADIENSKIIWARDMDGNKNDELVAYYKDRRVWLVEPDEEKVALMPYQSPVIDSSNQLMAKNR
jgi:hypothetical protein